MNFLIFFTVEYNSLVEMARERGHLVFGIKFYRECWSGLDAENTYNNINCWKGVGKEGTYYVYRI